MALIDRFGRAPLWMAAWQGLCFLASLACGAWGFGLGWRLVVPGASMALASAALVALTLLRPWSTIPTVDRGGPVGRLYVSWDPWALAASGPGLAALYAHCFSAARDTLYAVRAWPSSYGRVSEATVAAWRADAYGAQIVGGSGLVVFVLAPLLMLGLLWFVLE